MLKQRGKKMPEKIKYEDNINKILALLDKKQNVYRAPRSEEIIEILKIKYTEEEAAIGANMDIMPENPETIAERLNMKKEGLIPTLEKMCDKGTVYRTGEKGSYKYSLLPTDLGLFETSFGKGEENEETRELGKLWTNYFNGVWGKEFHSLQTQLMRVVAIEEKISGQTEILPYEKISGIIENASYLSVTNCACRSAKKLAGEACSLGAPTDVCLHFEDIGRYFVERGFAREVTKDECYEIMKRVQDVGLVHLTVNVKNNIIAICSCCPCCCVSLRGITQLNKPDAVAHSNYFSSIDPEICDGCKDLPSPVCIDRCPMDAISVRNDKVVCDVAKCIGCGICAHFCPVEGAVTLKKRKKIIEPKEDLMDLFTSVIQERE